MTYHNHPLSRPPGPVARPGRPRGFTVIELMVVIGVILVLIGIAVIGLNALTAGANSDATKTTLESLRAMVTEWEVTSKKPIGTLETGIGAFTGTPPTYAAPGDVSSDGSARAAFFINPGNHPTQVVMGRLLAVPANKTALAQLPSKSLLAPGNGVTPNPPVPADGWGNPVIFVPSGGLTGVVLSAGSATGTPAAVTVRANDLRPFWASAGPDGIFSFRDVNANGSFDAGTDTPGGDDNVYSFQN